MSKSDSARWIVLKFGGTSVSSRGAWETVLGIVRSRVDEGYRCIVVCSAISGVTAMLEGAFEDALDGSAENALAEIRAAHQSISMDLGIDLDEVCGGEMERLEKLLTGISLLRESGPSVRARVVASGELLSSRLGAAFLDSARFRVGWLDARDCLVSSDDDESSDARRFLSASCDFEVDSSLRIGLEARGVPVLVTQGFVARRRDGSTVLLGRGGSDTSAAYFAAKLRAERCEIWTDVPGMFSANPRVVPGARLLRRLDYDEAQEIATTGAKVLHPRCLAPLKPGGIPLVVKSTRHPVLEGTTISAESSSDEPRVKAISFQPGLLLISMESVGMWREPGFLADAFACFKRRSLSVDMVSTSETTVTVSLDRVSSEIDGEAIHSVLEDLGRFCRARVIGPCASVSLVGRRIRAILHKIGPALEAFEEQRIHMVTQAASDLNLTFVVDEDQAERLVRRLHGMIFEHGEDDGVFGPAWQQLFGEGEVGPPGREEDAWWRKRRETLLAMATEESPLYVYDRQTLIDSARSLMDLRSVDRLLFSIKANSNPMILDELEKCGLGFECVSAGEVTHVLSLFPEVERSRILFTPNFAPRREYEDAIRAGVIVTLDNLHPLEHWPESFENQGLFLRMDPGGGRGHHAHVRTAGEGSKFGIAMDQFDRATELAGRCGARIIGLHAHRGSGVFESELWAETALALAELASRHPNVRVLDLGGGLGVSERPGVTPFDLGRLDDALGRVRTALPAGVEIWLEPGRYLVATAGVLLTRVTQIKRKSGVTWVGVDTGMNSLIRPVLYGSYHEIVNLSRLSEKPIMRANVVGPICESGDVMGFDRSLPDVGEGDVLLIATTGAYGRVMSSRYNMREPAGERLI